MESARIEPVRVEPGPGQESVWDYPRPPAVALDTRRVTVEFGGRVIADTTAAIRILETSGPPTFYVPLEDVRHELLHPAEGSTFCEWKGTAAFVDVVVEHRRADRAGWHYPQPDQAYLAIAGHVAFYASRVDRCTVGGAEVVPQPGDYYGGWITPEIVGPFKGEPGTLHW
jgi:uncharacterized protein (DUF427 family)